MRSALAQAAPAHVEPAGRQRWLVVVLLFVATTINTIDRTMLGLLVPSWLVAVVTYPVLARNMGAGAVDRTMLDEEARQEALRQSDGAAYLAAGYPPRDSKHGTNRLLFRGATLSLVAAVVLAWQAFTSGDLARFQGLLVWPTVAYFIFVIGMALRAEKGA